MAGTGDRFLANIAKLMTGSSIATLISVISLPLLTRLFDPDAFGIYAMFTAVASILGVVACLRYEPTVVLPHSDSEAATQWMICIICACTVAALALIIVVVGDFSGLREYTASWPSFLLYLLPVYVLIHGVSLAQSAWHNRYASYNALASASVIYQTSLAIAAIAAGLAGFDSAAALILAFIAARAISVIFLSAKAASVSRRSALSGLGFSDITRGTTRFRRFPLFGMWSALLSMASWQLPVLLLGALFSPAIAGLYLLGFRILQMPMKIAGNAMNKVFLQQGSEAHREGRLAKLVEQLFTQIMRATLVPLAVLAVVAPELYKLVFGPDWTEAGLYTQILTPWALLWFLTGPFTGLFAILEQQPMQLRWNLLNFAARLAAILVGAWLGNAILTIALMSIAGVLTYGLKLLLTFRLVHLNLRIALVAGLPYLGIALASVTFLLVLDVLELDPVPYVATSIVIVLAYLIVTYYRDAHRMINHISPDSA